MSSASYRPEMTDAGLKPTVPVTAVDEYRNVREMDIADERPLTIYVDSYEIVTLMTLGSHPELLALGYLRNQGLVKDIREIRSVQVDWEVNAAAITTSTGRDDWKERLGPRIVTTGCGQGTVFGDIMEDLEKVRLTPVRLKQSGIYALLRNLNEFNEVYRSAGAVHGCALCRDERVMIFIEDVGRHNAVDAIAGRMWLEDIAGDDKLFYTTGRLTSEMVIKVAQMRIPVLLSRSGVTQMGLKLAQDLGVTMLSRVQSKHFLVYNGAEHIEFDVALPPKLEVAGLKKRASSDA
ncbi:MAG: formate dehydrogenase accessory sulfurtransferase FdhD [Gammaproteobacteria bacterium]|nr:formate dehydrogenase accessory sulfurtransferase FdhD [Gammaproteobacteria bacterium]